MPRVAFVNRVAPPAPGASGRMMADLAGELARLGWRVDVVAEQRPPRSNAARRALAGVTEAVALARRARRVGADVVVLMTDPPWLTLATPWLRERTAVVLWSLDVYPDLGAALGMVPSGVAAALALPFARARRRADAVVAIGDQMASHLATSSGRAVDTVSLWAPPGVRLQPPDLARRESMGLRGFVVGYSGNLGRAHPPGALLDAARLLAPHDVTVWIAGDGARRPHVEAEAQRLGLFNVVFSGFERRDSLSGHLALVDAHIVIQDPATLGLLLPSKVYGALASGRPTAVLGPRSGDANRLVAASPRGASLAVDDAEGLARWVLSLRETERDAVSPPDVPRLADSARAFDAVLRRAIAHRRATQ